MTTKRAMLRSRRGFFAIGIVDGKCAPNIGTLWRSAALYGAAYVFTVGRRYQHQAADTMKVAGLIPLVHYRDVDDLIEHLPESCPLIGVENTPGARDLTVYHHPERACYLLGAEDRGLSGATLARCHQVVAIPTVAPMSLNVAVAGSLVLYSRHCQTLARQARSSA